MISCGYAARAAGRGMCARGVRWALLLLASLAVAPTPAFAGNATVVEAAGVAKQAMDYYKAGEFTMAAELYRRAFRIDPTRPEYLFGLGRSLQNAQKYQDAMLAYESLLALLPATDPWSKKGRNALRELQTTMAALERTLPTKPEVKPEPAPLPVAKPAPEPVKPAPPPEPVAPPTPVKPPPVVVTPVAAPVVVKPVAAPVVVATAPPADPAPRWRTYARWGLLGAGAVAVIAGAAVYGSAASDRSALDGKLAQTQGSYISGISYADATAQAAAIGHKKTAGAVTLALGAAAALGGGALWLTDALQQSAWVPTPTLNGVQWAGRF